MPLSCSLLVCSPWYLWTYATALGIYCLCARVCGPWHILPVHWGVQRLACTVFSLGCAALGVYCLFAWVCSPWRVCLFARVCGPLHVPFCLLGCAALCMYCLFAGVCSPWHVFSVNWGVRPFVCTVVVLLGCAALRVYRSIVIRVCGLLHVPFIC